jgi:amino-acid N-acetyltransferase
VSEQVEPEAVTYGPASPDMRAAIVALLDACALPTEDLSTHPLEHFFVAHAHGALVGVLGLEPFDGIALMRSLAVAPTWRGRGVAHELWRRARAHALALGVHDVLLLTTTAEPLFARWGFQRIARDQAPEAVRGTSEYGGLCPVSAALMHLVL